MALKLLYKSVGPWPMNTYVVICEDTQSSVVIDPGAEPENILAMVGTTSIKKILLTHAHPDHVQALSEIKKASGAPIFMHPEEKEKFGINFDVSLRGGDILKVGKHSIRTNHTPGHTPGMMCFHIGENRVIVGDTIFVGGPGKTWSPKDFDTTMKTMQNVVFKWPDETQFFPGHGTFGTIGTERPKFNEFFSRGWDKNLFGDVSWEK